jgi:hypothetical protein
MREVEQGVVVRVGASALSAVGWIIGFEKKSVLCYSSKFRT